MTPTATVTPFQSGTPVAQVSFTIRFSPVYAANFSVFDVSTVTIQLTLDIQNLLLRVLQDDALAAIYPGGNTGLPLWNPVSVSLITPSTSTQPNVDASVTIYTSSTVLAPLLASALTSALGPAVRSRISELPNVEYFLKTLAKANVTGALTIP